MKNVILRYGIISGIVIASIMLLSTLIIKGLGIEKANFEYGMIIGYTNMILAFSAIYFAIRKYRDTHNDHKLSIKDGIFIGLGITVIATIFYSLMWLFVYYNIIPNFMEDYSAYVLEKLEASGASGAAIEQHNNDMASFKAMYNSPLSIFLITLIEPLPVGIIITIVSTLVLRRK
jgi:hypothetical protein